MGDARSGRDHVLLIGIDAYDGPGGSLRGCVNDIDAVQRLLIEKAGVSPERITRLVSPNWGEKHDTRVPERPPILANLRAELGRLGGEEVGKDDRVLVYYSGHGAQVVVEESNGARYTREALVPKDRVVNLVEDQYLFDWELNPLLSAITERTHQVTLVFDCCCSGGVTRELWSRPGLERRIVPTRPYRLPANRPPPPRASRRGLTTDVRADMGLCQVIAACQDDETARESDGDDHLRHGELTRALVAQLEPIDRDELRDVRWGRIWRSILATVARNNPSQHPSLSGGFARKVLGGPPEDGDPGIGIERRGGVYTVRAGTLSGVTKGAVLAVYGELPLTFDPIDSDADRAWKAPRVRVTSADLSTAEAVAVEASFELPEKGPRARLVKPGRADQIRVKVVPGDEDLEGSLRRSDFVSLVGAADAADALFVRRKDGDWALTDERFGTGEEPSDPWLVTLSPALHAKAPRLAEHYHGYSAPLRLAKNHQDLPLALRLTVHDASEAAGMSREACQDISHFPELPCGRKAPYEVRAGTTQAAAAPLCFGVHNDSATPLRVWIFVCNNSGSVFLFPATGLQPRASQVIWSPVGQGQAVSLTRMAGRDVSLDRIVVIGTTNRGASLEHLRQSRKFDDVLRSLKSTARSEEAPERPELWTSASTYLRVSA